MSTLRKREGAIESRERVVAQGNANLQTQREELGAREDRLREREVAVELAGNDVAQSERLAEAAK